MLVQFILMLIFLSFATTNEEETNIVPDYENWPFNYDFDTNIIRRDVPQEQQVHIKKDINSPGSVDTVPHKLIPDYKPMIGQTEGGVVNDVPSPDVELSDNKNDQPDLITLNKNLDPIKDEEGKDVSKIDTAKDNDTKSGTKIVAQPISKVDETIANNNTSKKSGDEGDINKPGVVKRGLIVFGGLSLLAVAYFIFYRNKHKKFDATNAHNTGDTNQFRYGVLHSEDRRENLELSRIPLTMESDEDDDDDLEIFDLEQRRKSLSYVNLQVNDEDIVLRSSKDESKNNLLLDIEDGGPDQLINWSGNGSKSIL